MNKKELNKILEKVMHPEINASLIGLGMIKDIKVEGKKVNLTLSLPFLGVPIEGMLIDSIKKVLKENGLDVEIKEDIMGSIERQKFLKISKEKWKSI